MGPAVVIDPATGDIAFGDARVSLGAPLADLPPSFATTEAVTRVEGRTVPCVFANATLDERGTRFALSLRYEQGRLVAAALAIEPPPWRDLSGDAFHASADARRQYHENWLKRTGLPRGPRTEMAWGTVGVALDKSDNAFVFVHPAPPPAEDT
jgi:hypothetical protein